MGHELNPRQTWWNVVDKVVDEHKKEHVSRSTQLTPNEAARKSNRDVVKTNLESLRRSDNPQAVMNVGDDVKVKSDVPDWTNKIYKVTEKKEGNTCARKTTNLWALKQCNGSVTQPMIFHTQMKLSKDLVCRDTGTMPSKNTPGSCRYVTSQEEN